MGLFKHSRRLPTGARRSLPPGDPDLEQFYKSMAAAEAQPPGNLGRGLSAQDVTAESAAMKRRFESGDLQAVWNRRVSLGYGAQSMGVPQVDWFWFNAAPALAALKLGLRDHPMTAMCCGVAEEAWNREDLEQTAAVREFNELYFG